MGCYTPYPVDFRRCEYKSTPARWNFPQVGSVFCISELRIVCDYLGFEGISTHSFRKWYATEIYNTNGFDIALVQRLLQHSSASTTQRYIGIEPQRIEQAIQNHAQLL